MDLTRVSKLALDALFAGYRYHMSLNITMSLLVSGNDMAKAAAAQEESISLFTRWKQATDVAVEAHGILVHQTVDGMPDATLTGEMESR